MGKFVAWCGPEDADTEADDTSYEEGIGDSDDSPSDWNQTIRKSESTQNLLIPDNQSLSKRAKVIWGIFPHNVYDKRSSKHF